MSFHCVWLIQQITTSDRYLSLIFLLPQHPVCILLFQCSAHAALWQSTQGRLSIPINPTPGSSLRASTPPDILSSKADPETDLSHAEDDEAGPTKGGCCCCCQVRTNLSIYLCKSFLTNRVRVFLRSEDILASPRFSSHFLWRITKAQRAKYRFKNFSNCLEIYLVPKKWKSYSKSASERLYTCMFICNFACF